jgi:hypothetical protein
MTKLIRFSLLCGLCLIMLFPMNSNAALSPVSVSVVPPVQFPSDSFSITGARLSLLWGRHRDLYGLDFGVLGNVTTQTFTGLSVSGLFNVTRGTTRVIGLQAAGAANVNTNKTDVYGFQLALGTNYNSASSTVNGIQFAGLANVSPHTVVRGFQIGLYNRALTVYGFQIGLVNVANALRGVQIGLANFHYTGLFYVSPIINVGF